MVQRRAIPTSVARRSGRKPAPISRRTLQRCRRRRTVPCIGWVTARTLAFSSRHQLQIRLAHAATVCSGSVAGPRGETFETREEKTEADGLPAPLFSIFSILFARSSGWLASRRPATVAAGDEARPPALPANRPRG